MVLVHPGHRPALNVILDIPVEFNHSICSGGYRVDYYIYDYGLIALILTGQEYEEQHFIPILQQLIDSAVEPHHR